MKYAKSRGNSEKVDCWDPLKSIHTQSKKMTKKVKARVLKITKEGEFLHVTSKNNNL